MITLHPSIAGAYRTAVRTLTQLLEGEAEENRKARQALRSLIDRINITPTQEKRGMHIDIEGRLQAMMALATGKPAPKRFGTLKMVAEEGLEPPTRGL